jgi:hypothetical protein
MENEYVNKNVVPPLERIDYSTGQLMAITALFLDFFQGIMGAIPVAGQILSPLISIFIWLTFFVWLKLHEITIIDNIKRLAIMAGGSFLEIIPIINIAPIWTITILITVMLVKVEDKNKIKDFYKQNIGFSQ